jgi:hypothetical protein
VARSLLKSLVDGTRQMLTVQVFVGLLAVALAGWTLGVTNDLVRERVRMRDRVIQLEQTLAERGIVVPAPPNVVETAPPAQDPNAYPGAVGALARDADAAPTESTSIEIGAPPPAEADGAQSFQRVIGDLFAPPPPMRLVVLHLRATTDAAQARAIADALVRDGSVRVIIDVMSPRDPRQSGYIYFDGRQSRAAAAMVTQFHDTARTQQIAEWSAQLRGVALPAQGEYSVDRLDIVLPPLPPPPPAPPVIEQPAVAATPPIIP